MNHRPSSRSWARWRCPRDGTPVSAGPIPAADTEVMRREITPKPIEWAAYHSVCVSLKQTPCTRPLHRALHIFLQPTQFCSADGVLSVFQYHELKLGKGELKTDLLAEIII
ncbi:hypothetical protein BaRGS_00022577 [Batillaria attramentaria]|uniref:Uncharacterized protein n=1 Tax=Batillaria attramentaria TaxID=370345 RepID=A0ABD0KGP2_9CAEN